MQLKCNKELKGCVLQSNMTFEKCYGCSFMEVDNSQYLDSIYDKDGKKIFDTDYRSTDGKIIPKSEQTLDNFTEDVLGADSEQIVEKADINISDMDSTDRAMRFNTGKPQWSLVHFKSLEPMIRVLEFGALKYAPKNWQKPMPLDQILESMQRHLASIFDGEEVDSESGISHMGHIMCNAMFYIYHKNKQDDTK